MVGTNNKEGHIIIDINELVHSMHTLPDETPKNNIKSPVIHKVGWQDVRDNDREVYEPKVLSIGPYHQGSPVVQDMQRAKYIYLDYILNLNPKKKLADYLSAIKGLEKQARCAYANEIDMDRDAFLRTLLLDGCFILVALNGIEGIVSPTPCCNLFEGKSCEVNADTEVTQSNAKHKITQNIMENLWEQEDSNHKYLFYKTVSRDLLLLENQIPFSIVQKIYEVLAGRIDASSLLTKNIAESIMNMISYHPKKIKEDHQPILFYHLLHLCHMLFKPNYICNHSRKEFGIPDNHSKLQFLYHSLRIGSKFNRISKQVTITPDIELGSSTIHAQTCPWRQATIYHAAKIEFIKKENHSGTPHYSLLDIGFCNGTIEIPSLTIDRRRYCLLCNLVAFEQACPQLGNYVSAYVVFWSQLVSTPDDAALLTDKGILINQLQSDTEVAKLFSSLSEDVVFDHKYDYYLKPICHMVEAHYQRQRSRWREILGTISSNIPRWVRHNY